MDQPKMERLLRLMKLLSGNVNYSIEELSDKLDMSVRTIYRYIDTFKAAGFSVTKLYGDTYKLGKMPKNSVELEKLIYFSEEEAYLVNSLIDSLAPTNSLKANLKDKLSAIYASTSIADYVSGKSNAARVEDLGQAIQDKRKVILRGYESGSSHTIRDRHVEPFGFTTDYVDVCAFDLDDGRNKVFKISRIGDVEVLDEEWTKEDEHRKFGMDIFRMNGQVPKPLKLRLSLKAKNLLLEEFPMAARDLRPEDQAATWLLDTSVFDYRGACRFYLGLADEISIVDSPEFSDFVKDFVAANLKF